MRLLWCVQDMMKKNKPPSSRRAEFQQLYQSYAGGQTTLPASALLRFLHKEQMELTANEEVVETLIDRFEIEEAGKWRESFSSCQNTFCSSLQVKKWCCLQGLKLCQVTIISYSRSESPSSRGDWLTQWSAVSLRQEVEVTGKMNKGRQRGPDVVWIKCNFTAGELQHHRQQNEKHSDAWLTSTGCCLEIFIFLTLMFSEEQDPYVAYS